MFSRLFKPHTVKLLAGMIGFTTFKLCKSPKFVKCLQVSNISEVFKNFIGATNERKNKRKL